MSTEIDESKFEKFVALTTSFIAVGLAISTILNNAAGDDLLVFRSEANNKWSYFQSKSIKQNIVEMEIGNIELSLENENISENYKAKAKEKIAYFESEVKRYDTEKDQIGTEAKTAEGLMEKADKKGLKLDLAEALYQISIVLAAISMIAKNRPTWYLSMALGGLAICITTYAHFFMP
ncbi:MAG: DUF4337 domain-containing protein [Cytophagales bacterium]|nr:MAG: DUF4337 domain-containing protein [Cytophagales bacterium]